MTRFLLTLLLGLTAMSASAQTRRRVSAPARTEPPRAAAPVARGGEPVGDGSFEQTVLFDDPRQAFNPFWDNFSVQFGTPLCDSTCTGGVRDAVNSARTGKWWTWFGGTVPDIPEDAEIAQGIQIPTPTATLRFWMRMRNDDGGVSDGQMRVTLGRVNDFNSDSLLAVFTSADLPDFPADQPYRLVSIPVRSTGVPQRLSFFYRVSAAQPSLSLFIDDVTLGPPVPGALLIADASPKPQPRATVAVVRDTLVFGDVQLAADSVRTVSLTNLGADPAVVGTITFAGTPGVTVVIDRSRIPASIPPGGQATFGVRLRTAVRGPITGTLTVASNTPGPPRVLNLLANGILTTVRSVCAGQPVDLPAGPPTVYAGPAGPYPSVITVAGITDPVYDVDVRLVRLTHGVTRQIDLGLVHPQGPALILMSDVGLATPVSNLMLRLSDEAPEALGQGFETLRSGTFHPTNVTVNDEPFQAPAPFIPSGTQTPLLSVFDGRDPNGPWRLFGRDDEAIGAEFDDQGQIADWCLDIETTDPLVVADEPGADAPAPALTVWPNPAASTAAVRLTGTGGMVTVALFDALGRRVAVVHEGRVTGEAAFAVDVSRLPAGVYVVRALGEGVALAQRLTVVR